MYRKLIVATKSNCDFHNHCTQKSCQFKEICRGRPNVTNMFKTNKQKKTVLKEK